ncbi:hypothetical protein ACTFIZ_012352 [Dictyostelium cf. discoideum]
MDGDLIIIDNYTWQAIAGYGHAPEHMKTLHYFSVIDKNAFILPSHGRPFIGIHTRIAQLQTHHMARLEETLIACQQKPSSAFDIVQIMFKRSLDLHQMTFAMGEALALALTALALAPHISHAQSNRDGELSNKYFDEVTWIQTHNSFANRTDGWIWANQGKIFNNN